LTKRHALIDADIVAHFQERTAMYKPTRLHHVGIIMQDEERANRFIEKFGFEIDHVEPAPYYNAYVMFLKPLGANQTIDTQAPEFTGIPWPFSVVELVIPVGEGAIKHYNRGMGGLHHIAISVEDLDTATQHFQNLGMDFLGEAPNQLSDGCRTRFLQLRFGEGVVIELIQEARLEQD
jgi:catechol 2,3-dioxygenase-like lactoylglutathione lyase family enzyme